MFGNIYRSCSIEIKKSLGGTSSSSLSNLVSLIPRVSSACAVFQYRLLESYYFKYDRLFQCGWQLARAKVGLDKIRHLKIAAFQNGKTFLVLLSFSGILLRIPPQHVQHAMGERLAGKVRVVLIAA